VWVWVKGPVSECPLESPPSAGQWPVVIGLLLFAPISKYVKVSERTKILGPDTKVYCAGEDQQQFNPPADSSSVL
jgi:hypothetical protein